MKTIATDLIALRSELSQATLFVSVCISSSRGEMLARASCYRPKYLCREDATNTVCLRNFERSVLQISVQADLSVIQNNAVVEPQTKDTTKCLVPLVLKQKQKTGASCNQLVCLIREICE